MRSIYEVIDLDEEREQRRDREPVERPPLPTRVTHLGCGLHRFERDDDGSFWCKNVGCTTVIRPGQLLHRPLEEALG